MANKVAIKITALLALASVGMLTACGSSGSSTPAPVGNGALSGNWQVALTNTSIRFPKVSTENGSLVQSGKQVSGNLTFLSNTCAGTGTVSGTAEGSAVTLTVNQPGLGINLTGDMGTTGLNANGAPTCTAGSGTSASSCLTGTYVLLASGCGTSESGAWNGFQVQPLNATLSGTLTQNVTGVTSTASVTLKQGANTGGTSTVVTGTLTPSAGASACIPTAALTGQISGNSVVLAALSGPDNTVGTIKGQIQGAWLPLGNGTLTEPVLDFSRPGSGYAYNFTLFKACKLNGSDPNCVTPDLNNINCVVDPTCVPDPIDPSKCPGPLNPKCTGIKVVGCEGGKGTLCQSGAC